MLRLNIQESLPWTDSRGRTRSPLEEFQFLDESVREAIRSGEVSDVTLWEFGVLRDTGGDSGQLKPQGRMFPPGALSYSVGYQNAPEFKEHLAGLWQQLVNWLAGETPIRVFVSDMFDLLTGERIDDTNISWSDFVLNEGFSLARIGRPGMYTGRLEPVTLSTLLGTWWPSGLGSLAGMILTEPEVDGRIETTRTLCLDAFSGVKHCFQTSRSYDNLGIVVLTRGMEWSELEAELESHGWYTGRLLNMDIDDQRELA